MFPAKEARALLKGIDRLVAAKGQKIVKVDLRGKQPGWGELSSLMLGPTGKLRAPVIRVGKTVIVGFTVEMYESLLA